ncbi:MAG: pseudouridine synthase [Monoraphidium minutum]|nr:MAG: pseudouridine synthase [Monoraphidium minutum]
MSSVAVPPAQPAVAAGADSASASGAAAAGAAPAAAPPGSTSGGAPAAAPPPPALKKHMRVVESIAAPPGFEPRRLPAALRALLPVRYPSDTAAKKAARRGEVLLGGQKAGVGSEVVAGAVIEIVQRCGADPLEAAGKPGLAVIYEDDHMACVVKPQGLPTQGKGEGSLQGRIKYCLAPSTADGCLARPHHAHRLDAPTGGLVLVGKTRAALAALGADLREHRMQKRYVALVAGRVAGEGAVEYPLDGRAAVTLFRAVQHHPPRGGGGGVTRVYLWPKTGRTHQLRKHMAYLGHPLLGERQYQHRRKDDIRMTSCAVEPLLQGMSAPEAAAGGSGGGGDAAAEAEGGERQAPEPCGEGDGGGGRKRGRPGLEGRGAPAEGAAQQRAAGAEAEPGGRGAEAGEEEGAGEASEAEADAEAEAGAGGGGAGAAAEPLCLWAVELRLRHPVTREPLHFHIPDPPEYDARCVAAPLPPGGAP